MKTKKGSVKRKDFGILSISVHRKYGGKLELKSKFKLENKDDLSIAYTPGVAAVCLDIEKNHSAKELTLKKNTILVVSDGSAVLGLGNIGASAAIPVMEGKSVLMKHFANVDAFPICLQTQNVDEIVKTIKYIEPVFGGVNLEDISAPRCFEIEERLKKELGIPVMHDDQWGAATVALAALINALKVVGKKNTEVSIALVGAGAAGIATAKLLEVFKVKNLTVFDTKGAIWENREDLKNLKEEEKSRNKKFQIALLNKLNLKGGLIENIHNFDVFIGLSKPNMLTAFDVKKMKKDPIIFALANPNPEILPEEALKGGAKVVGTGRSDYPNQVNNSLFFPGFWRGMLDKQHKTKSGVDTKNYSLGMLVKIAENIAKLVKPTQVKILPSTLDKKVHKVVAQTVLNYKKHDQEV